MATQLWLWGEEPEINFTESDLKSMLQKGVRRGRLDLALYAASHLSPSTLFRRLAVVIVEEGMPELIPAWKESRKSGMLRVVKAAVLGEKDIDFCWIDEGDGTKEELVRLIKEGDDRAPEIAAGVVRREGWRWLRDELEDLGVDEGTLKIAKGMLYRMACGMRLDWDGQWYFQAVVKVLVQYHQGIVRKPMELGELEEVRPEEIPQRLGLEDMPLEVWDGHTKVGKQALRKVSQKTELSLEDLDWIVFLLESGCITHKGHETSGARRRMVERKLREIGITEDEGREIVRRWRGEVARCLVT